MLIDAHCHINSLSEIQKEELVAKSESGYIFIDISIDFESAVQSIALSQECNNIYTSLGFHPINGGKFCNEVVEKYISFIKDNKKVVALGEVGLDYKSTLGFKDQEGLLLKFTQLSREYNLPLIIHNRWQNNLIFDILNKHFSSFRNIIFHCFSQDKEFLSKVVERRGYASFSLNILRNQKKIIESLQMVPLDNLLLETDSPYMKINGRYSSPLDIERVYHFVAKTKKLTFPKLSKIICFNTERVFGIKIG